MRRTFVLCGLATVLLFPFGQAEAQATALIVAQADTASVAVGDLVVENPWARESVTRTGAVYLSVRNDGDRDDRLEQGGSFPLTLEFENAGPVEVTATIEDIGHGT